MMLLLLLHVVLSWAQETPPPVTFEGRMSDDTKDAFAALFDEAFMQMMVDCQQLAGDTCDVTGLAESMIQVGNTLKNSFEACPMGCTHPPANCKDFWMAFESNPVALRNKCALTNNWPGVCTVFLRELQVRVADDTWELPVMCRLIDPGLNLERMPRCKVLAQMTAVNRLTLHDGGCAFSTRDECISNLCDVYSQFTWRMQPRNLIPERFKMPFDDSYVIQGCEGLVPLDMYNRRDECPKRLDILGFCDCLCPAMPDVLMLGVTDCPTIVDEYLMFGRLGVSNMTFDSLCETELCDAFNTQRLKPACRDTKLPGTMECIGMQIPKVMPEMSPCPWRNHSGEENIMECLNGHRCDIVKEGWYCCERHRGRAKCPLELPVMCDTLCSGITEYCCRTEGECTPRACPVILQRDLVYKQDTTTSTTTTPEGRDGNLGDQGLVLRLPQGSWAWLLVLVPLTGGLVLCCYVRRRNHKVDMEQENGDVSMGLQLDTFGFFHAYKAENRAREETRPRICIVMSELPDTRPLGLELVELRVVRVHPWGKKHGWQVGDIIVDIAGQKVTTFEELWERIQMERNRPPVRFTVERWNIATTAEEERAADLRDENVALQRKKRQLEEDREQRSKSRVASKTMMASTEPSGPRTLGPNALPGMAHGWDDEYEEDDDFSYYSDDDSRLRTFQSTSSFPTGNFKSRFTTAFQVLVKEDPKEKTPEKPDSEKPEPVFPQDLERRTFHKDKVVFTRDVWGRSVVKVMNPTKRSPD
ncbi:unnamed protein product [Effrenium voratum]|nr:unnamed protein product [Effrenium voratum]|mmetsp:Transcript_33241/g.79630  ORF Transcript_33241/g.79630 Transcript_33241/m.79630 type:complete len:757 (+) Transcript_33241:89-2359(+)